MSLIEEIAARLIASGQRLATAESCTGGLVGHWLTNLPGSSRWYEGGIVAYSYAAKRTLLGVDPETLNRVGAVSAEVARQMALGVRQRLGSDYGLAVTGIAGPQGATDEKAVGLTYIAVATPTAIEVQRCQWHGTREGNKQSSADAVLRLLHDLLYAESEPSHAQQGVEAMNPHAVEALFERDGTLRPRSFVWQGRQHHVSDHGRQWRDGAVRHFLVMSMGRVWELRFHEQQLTWEVEPKTDARRVV
ncbi:MAG: CinA family protein [Anaerolineales bacterium]|nr:CinA family protein [Anaerolineales bacterium]MCB9128291.1 CinA family protein [Ardenticatenales bacterium]MCB9172082.1 CinA family protein [Ardenticatenales bacterium]